MKKTIFRYMFMAAVAGFVAVACDTPEGVEPTGGETTVQSATTELGSAVYGTVIQTRAVNESDPTLTPIADRAAQGHKLTIKIGGESKEYGYSDGSWTTTGIGVKFPGNAASDVTLTLAPEADDPVVAQDGTVAKLIDADVLTATIEEQAPVNDLPQTALIHANSLLVFEIDGHTATELNGTTITINSDIVPCRTPATGTKLQAIVKPGAATATVFVGIGTDEFSAFVGPAEGNFMPNTRYTFKIILEVQGIRIENVAVSQWDEKEPGTGTVTPAP